MWRSTRIILAVAGLSGIALSVSHLYFAMTIYAAGENFGTSIFLSALFLLVGIRMLKMAKSKNKDSC